MRRAALLLAAVAALLSAAVPTWAAVNGDGDLRVSLEGGISPKKLPRERLAPVAVRVSGDVRSASGATDGLPQLRRISVGINRDGRLFDRGLPVCRARRIRSTRQSQARRVCGGAIVGSGHVTVRVHIPDQPRFVVRARLVAFNGPRRDGHKLILAQVYAKDPPGSFILAFRVKRRKGVYGTVLTTTLPQGTRRWAYLTHFDMTLHRLYRYQGERRSYVSAACSAPAGLSTVVFPFARAAYSFDSGQRLTVAESGTCHAVG